MKYNCLILDHDDTCVDSTETIHLKAHHEILRTLRPEMKLTTIEKWFEKNFHPGITAYLTEELEFTPREMEEEFQIWRSYNEKHIPEFYPGILDMLKEFKSRGGWVTVVSHSEERFIRRTYQEKGEGFMPDLIFGWEHDPDKRKPHPYPVEQILTRLNVPGEKALVIDDLKPGIEMARAAGVDAAAACWAHSIPVIRHYMEEHCVTLLESVEQMREFLF